MFCCGLMKDPTPLVEHCYEMYIEKEVNVMRTDEYDDEAERELEVQAKDPDDMSLFTSLYNESHVELPGGAHHNRYINKYNHEYNHDMTPVYTPSQYYKFYNMKEDVELYRRSETEIPECIMVVNNPDESVTKSLLTTCHKIS